MKATWHPTRMPYLFVGLIGIELTLEKCRDPELCRRGENAPPPPLVGRRRCGCSGYSVDGDFFSSGFVSSGFQGFGLAGALGLTPKSQR